MNARQSSRAVRVVPEELYGMIPVMEDVLLMLDYDGTLVPIADRPENTQPGEKLLFLLGNLALRPGLSLAVISGRAPSDLATLLPVERIIRVACHGAHISWPSGQEEFATVAPAALDAIRELTVLAKQLIAGRRGFLVEDKITNLALHYRLATPAEAGRVLREFVNSAGHIIKKQELEILHGKKVCEIRPRGINKGTAVKRLLNEFEGAFPVYFGDDTTDEDAFHVLSERGLSVLVASHVRNTAALYRLNDWREVRTFLSLLERSGRHGWIQT